MKTYIGLAVGGLVLAAAGCSMGTTPMENAVSECELQATSGVRLGDDGNSLTVNTGGEEREGVSTAGLVCILNTLEVPDHVSERMSTTRALDGTQSAQWNGMEGTWNYHPNTGMNFVVSRIE